MDNKVKNLAILSGDSYFTKIINDLDIFYKEKLSDKSYKVLNTEEKENGFQAKVYKNDKNEITIAYAGTNPTSSKDLLNDDEMLFGYRPTQLGDAIDLYEKIKQENPNASIDLTGHSLGGMLAIQVALYEAKKEMVKAGGITKENFLQLKEDGKISNTTVFEAPSIFLLLSNNSAIADSYDI